MEGTKGKAKREETEYREGEALSRIWLDLKRLLDSLGLCIDGFYLRQEAEFDVVVNIMESYKNNVGEILKMVRLMEEKSEERGQEAKN